MASDQSFDPRFDPAFQRGFGDAQAQRTGVDLSAPERPAVGGPSVHVAASGPVAPFASPSMDADSSRGSMPLDAAHVPVETSGNPWLRALWGIAAALIVAGIAGQWIAIDLFSTGASSGSVVTSYVLPSVLQALAPWFLVAGLLAAIAAVTIKALRWHPLDA